MPLRPPRLCPRCGGAAPVGGDCPCRPNPRQRGYGRDYDLARAVALATSDGTCPTCGEAFTAANPPTGGHRKPISGGGTTADGIFAQCRRCNYGRRPTSPRPGKEP